MSKEYPFRAKNVSIEAEKSKVIAELNQRIADRQDFKVIIQPLNFRGMPAVRAYWMVIGRVVYWMNEQGNTYSKDEVDYYFKDKAGLVKNVDKMPFWKLQYKDKLANGYDFRQDVEVSGLFYLEYNNSWNEDIVLGKRWQTKARSISNKGDVTKDEMSRLLTEVIKFGAENDIPDCYIEDREFKRMVEACER